MGTRGYGPFSTETPITFVKKPILHLGTNLNINNFCVNKLLRCHDKVEFKFLFVTFYIITSFWPHEGAFLVKNMLTNNRYVIALE